MCCLHAEESQLVRTVSGHGRRGMHSPEGADPGTGQDVEDRIGLSVECAEHVMRERRDARERDRPGYLHA